MIFAALASLWLSGGLTANLGPVDRVQITTTATTGTGLSLAGSGRTTLTGRSPVFMNLEIGMIHPNLPWLEFSPGVSLELERRVGIGINPKFRAFAPIGWPKIYGLAGLPVFFAPYSLVGIQGGAGAAFHVHRVFAVVVEGSASVFFWGSDLMKGSALGKLDIALGLRWVF